MKKFNIALGAMAALMICAAPAGAAVTSTTDASTIARAIAEKPSQVINAEFVGQQTTASPGPAGVGSGGITGFPTAGADFGVLTTGNAQNAVAGAQSFFASTTNGVGPPVLERGTHAFDYVVLKINVQIPVGANCASADMRFMSEEFPSYINSGYNDSFLVEVDRSTWTATGSGLNAPDDVAASSGQRITVDTLGVSGFTAASAEGTVYGGGSPLLQARFRVTPGKHQIYLSVLDQGDASFDSAAFVDNLRFTNEPTGSCSFQGQGDNTPASLITCGPLGTLLTPCEGLLPKPPKLTVCGPEYGTILKSCKGLGLGLGPAPFLGGETWDDLLVKCPNLGDSCSADIDAFLEPKGNPSLGKVSAVKTRKKSRRALATLSADLADKGRKIFELARILDSVTTSTSTKKMRTKPVAGVAMFSLSGLSNGLAGAKVNDMLEQLGFTNQMLSTMASSVDSISLNDLSEMFKQATYGYGPPRTTFRITPFAAGRYVNERGKWVGDYLKDAQKMMTKIDGQIAGVEAAGGGVVPHALFDDLHASLANVGTKLTGMTAPANEWAKADGSGKWSKDARQHADKLPSSINNMFNVLAGVGLNNGLLSGLSGQLEFARQDEFLEQMNKMYDSLAKLTGQVSMIGAQSTAISSVVNEASSQSEKGNFAQLDLAMAASGRSGGWFMPFADGFGTLTNGSSSMPNAVTEGDLESTNDLIAFGVGGFGSSIQFSRMLDALGLTADEAMDGAEPIKDPLLQNLDPGNEVVIAGRKKSRRRAFALGSTTAVIKQGKTVKLKLKLSREARNALRKVARTKRGRRLTVTLVVTTRNAGGKTVTKTFKVKVGNGKRNRHR